MLSPSDTAYPMLKANPSARELTEIFTPTLFELGCWGVTGQKVALSALLCNLYHGSALIKLQNRIPTPQNSG